MLFQNRNVFCALGLTIAATLRCGVAGRSMRGSSAGPERLDLRYPAEAGVVRQFLAEEHIVPAAAEGEEQETCAMCLDEFKAGETVLSHKGCGRHMCHPQCFENWILTTATAEGLVAWGQDLTNPRLNRAMQCATCNARAPRHDDVFDALRAFQAVRRDPENAYAHLSLGTALWYLEKHDEAKAAYERAIELGPQNAEAHTSLIELLGDMGKTAEAEAACNAWLGVELDESWAHERRCRWFTNHEKNDEAVRSHVKWTEAYPQAGVHNELGITLYALGKYEDAKNAYERANEISPSAAQYHNLGNALTQLSKFEDAQAAYEQAIVLDPQHGETHLEYGILLKKMKKADESAAALQTAIKLRPNNLFLQSDAHTVLGNLHWNNDNIHDAKAEYEVALASNPQNVRARINLGDVFVKMNEFEKAKAAYEKAIEASPQNAEAHADLGAVLEKLNKPEDAKAARERAIALYEETIRTDPQNAEAHLQLGSVLRELENYDEAEAACERVIELEPQNAEAHTSLGNFHRDGKF